MNWFLLSLGCAFFTSTTAALSKILLKKRALFFVGWLRFAFSLPFVMILYLILRPDMHFTASFWKTVMVLLPLEVMAFLLYLKALKMAPISLVFPLLGLTPAFTIATSYILLGEKVGAQGIAGVITVSIGAYLLNVDTIHKGFLEPFKSIFSQKGSVLMIIVAFLFSLTAVMGKRVVAMSSPLSFATVYYVIFFSVLSVITFARRKNPEKAERITKKDIVLFGALGASFTTAVLLHFHAVLLTNVAYMISVKRLSLMMSVFYGAIIFKEEKIRYRLLGASVMVCGVLLLAFA
ncbi:MAG: DMT family transporter [Candidatus Omnitrophota bacterium]